MMKKYLFLFLSGLFFLAPLHAEAQKGKSVCFVTHFKSQVLKANDPDARAQVAENWLRNNLSSCTSAQLQAIKSNSPLWLGTALTTEIYSLIEVSIEASISGNHEQMGKLYGSLGKEGTASTVTTTNPTARAPIVQAPIIAGPVAGAVNYGNITTGAVVNSNANTNANVNTNTNPR